MFQMKKAAVLLVVMMLALQVSACYFFPQEEQLLSPPLREPQQIEYSTVEVTRGDIEKRINGTGYFVSDVQTDLFFTFRGGRIKSINFKNGDMVQAGDVVIELESENLENQILQLNMNLQKLKLNLEQNLKNIERSIVLADLQLLDLEKEYERVKEIAENLDESITLEEVLPGTDLEDLKNSVKRQEFVIEGEHIKYENAKATAELDIKAIEFQLSNLHQELEKTKLISPVTGKIVWLTSSSPGEYIYTYTNLCRIADVDKLKLKYTGEGLSEFKINGEVEITIDGESYGGIVVMNPSTAPFDADDSIRRSVMIKIDDLPEQVVIGYPARLSLLVDQRENVIVIPRDLVKGFMGQKTVYILDDGLKKDRSIQTGIESATQVEITGGLEEGELLIEG